LLFEVEVYRLLARKEVIGTDKDTGFFGNKNPEGRPNSFSDNCENSATTLMGVAYPHDGTLFPQCRFIHHST
jgi:hypothetical protein